MARQIWAHSFELRSFGVGPRGSHCGWGMAMMRSMAPESGWLPRGRLGFLCQEKEEEIPTASLGCSIPACGFFPRSCVTWWTHPNGNVRMFRDE